MASDLYVLKEVLPHVYHVSFHNHYQLVMHFLRVQDFYESPKYQGQIFTLIDHMEWYAETYGNGVFTYPSDWSGFNVPSWVLAEVYLAGKKIPDFNKYDRNMVQLIHGLDKKEWNNRCGTNRYYLIGTSKAGYRGNGDEDGLLEHELAHGLYFTDAEYKKQAEAFLDILDPVVYADLWETLHIMGYAERVRRDEIHAYLATGLCKDMEGMASLQDREPFIRLFEDTRKVKVL